MKTDPVVIVGAGPAGLAAAQCLRQSGVETRILERGGTPGHSWASLYDSLRLHTGKHLSSLPARGFSSSTPLFPSRQDFLEYLNDYVRHFELPVETGCEVLRASWRDGVWMLETSRGSIAASGLVLATGMIGRPFRPEWPGMHGFSGEIFHSVEYRNPACWIGRRTLVVGVGNSGAEIAAELAEAGVPVSVSVRTGAHVMPLSLLGVPIQYWALLLERFPRPIREVLARTAGAISRIRHGAPVLPVPPWSRLERPPVIGFKFPQAIQAGKIRLEPDIARFRSDEIVFTDGRSEVFDAVILATGFRAALGFLAEPFEADERGFPAADGVRCRDLPHCWLVGHRYAAVGALANIRRDAVRLASEIRA